MSFLYEAGKRRRVMHLHRFSKLGEPTWRPLCGIEKPFNRDCNLPLGRRTCKRCLVEARKP